jgi:hypothetical protein
MPLQRRNTGSLARISLCLVTLLVARSSAAAGPGARSGSTALLDSEDDAQFAHLQVRGATRVEPTSEAHQGKRAARIVYSGVLEGVRDYPAVIVEGEGLKVRDFSTFEAISLWVLNPGPDEAELSLAVWDKDGPRPAAARRGLPVAEPRVGWRYGNGSS